MDGLDIGLKRGPEAQRKGGRAITGSEGPNRLLQKLERLVPLCPDILFPYKKN